MNEMLKSQTDGRRIGTLRNDMLAAGEEYSTDLGGMDSGHLDAWGFYGCGCFIHVMSSKDINTMHDPDYRNQGMGPDRLADVVEGSATQLYEERRLLLSIINVTVISLALTCQVETMLIIG